MEWVVTTAKTVDEAKDRALDQLGVAADEAEFEIVEEPRTGLFGCLKVEARVRARVKPAQVRPNWLLARVRASWRSAAVQPFSASSSRPLRRALATAVRRA